jgi:hypothetical protein
MIICPKKKFFSACFAIILPFKKIISIKNYYYAVFGTIAETKRKLVYA